MSEPNLSHVRLCNVRSSKLTRRQALQSFGAALGIAGTNTACEPETAALIVELLIQLSKLAFAIAEEVTGDLAWENTGNTIQTIEGVLCLVRKTASGESIDDETSAYFEVPPGESVIGFAGLFGEEAGDHLVEVLTAVGNWQSESFPIR